MNSDATASNIVNSFTYLSTEVASTDTFIFYFSGHGYGAPDTNGDEADGIDESIVSRDLYFITDD